MASGRKQRANSKRGRLQRPDLSEWYDRTLTPIEPGGFVFRSVLVRPEKPREERYMTLDRALTELDWGDQGGSVLTGTMSLRRPGPRRVAALPVQRGHRVRLQLFWGGRWRRQWDMRVAQVPEVDLKTGTLTAPLEDDLNALSQNVKEWDFKKDKQHPHGWTADEVTVAVCKDQHVRPGRIAQGTKKITKLKLKGSGLEIIRKAWAMEKAKTGVRYVVKFNGARLDVLPFRRPDTVYIISAIEKGATTAAEAKTKRPVTQIKAKGRIKGTGKDKKIEETVRSPVAIAKFGFSEEEKDYGRVNSRADLRQEARRDLAASIKVERTATLSLPGIPFLEKGSCIRWLTNEPGWSGKVGNTEQDRSYAYVTTAHHTLSPSSYDTEIQINQDDPYFTDRKRRDKERRDKKKQERKGRKPKQKAKAKP